MRCGCADVTVAQLPRSHLLCQRARNVTRRKAPTTLHHLLNMGAAGPVLSVPTPVLQVAVLVLLLALFGAWPAVLLWLALQPLLALLHLRALVSRPDPAFSKV